MNILITAFEPFGNNNVNSSLIALNNLSSANNLTKLILPVTYEESFIKLKEQTKNIDLIIMLGMAESRNHISLEERAQNILDFRIPDNNNVLISNQLISNNEEYLYTKIDIDNLLLYLNDSNIVKSSDAGKYICNYLYYKVLEEIGAPSIFIHIPLYKTNTEYEYLNKSLSKILNHLGGKDEKNI